MSNDKWKMMVVLMTTANGEEASRLAEMLVGSRLAACVQILPEIESVYRWKGKVRRAAEVLLLAKTTQTRFAELERQIRALHSYETPEIIALPVTQASEPYLGWLIGETELGSRKKTKAAAPAGKG
jgi:periplasmic divalent cation tolerance protein